MDPFVLFDERVYLGIMNGSDITMDCTPHVPSNATMVLLFFPYCRVRPVESSIYMTLTGTGVSIVPLGPSKQLYFDLFGGYVSDAGEVYLLGYATGETYVWTDAQEMYRGREDQAYTWNNDWMRLKVYPDQYGIPANATAVQVCSQDSPSTTQRMIRLRFPDSYEIFSVGQYDTDRVNVVVPIKNGVAEFDIRGYNLTSPSALVHRLYVVGYFTAGDFDLDDYAGYSTLALDDLTDSFYRVGPPRDTAIDLCAINYYRRTGGFDAVFTEKKDGDATPLDTPEWGSGFNDSALSYVPVDETGYSRYSGEHNVYRRFGAVRRKFVGGGTLAGVAGCGMAVHKIASLGSARSTSDYKATIKVSGIWDDSSYIAVGLVVRHTDENNYYFGLYHRLLKAWLLGKVVDGVNTTMAVVYDTISGDDFTMSLRVVGSQLSLRMNDTPMVNGSDSSLTGPGKAGIVGVK